MMTELTLYFVDTRCRGFSHSNPIWFARHFGGLSVRHCIGYERMNEFALQLEKNIVESGRCRLLHFMTTIRLSPWTPCWFVTHASARLGVSLVRVVLPSVVLAMIPHCVTSAFAGSLLRDMLQFGEAQLTRVALLGCSIAVQLFVPFLASRWGDRRKGGMVVTRLVLLRKARASNLKSIV